MSEYQWPERMWPHQLRGCQEVVKAIQAGQRRIVLTAPTGCGKSAMMCALIEWASSEWWDSVLYTHRRLLLQQTSRVLSEHGIDHGIRAAGYEPALLRSVQLAMIQSEVSAVFKKHRRELHNARIALADELHANGGAMLPTINKHHYDAGAAVIGVTATPIDLEGDWDTLVVAGTTSEGRKCGALVPAYTYCPDEPDMRHIGREKVGEDLTDKENSNVMFGPKGIFRPKVFGRVLTHLRRLNPDLKPTILFAPDVPGSIYFAEQFHKNDVRAAHIDAKQIWLDGEYMESSDDNRQIILKMFRDGDIQVLCNRFVLREGIDLPEVAHMILACVFGSLKTYLQAGGRGLRAHESIDRVVCQDHGANFRRHGSLNADRVWELGMKGRVITGLRQEAMRERPDLEPINCPQCGMARLSGPTCHRCGHTCHKRSRMVVQVNGDLKPVDGPAYKPHRIRMEPDTADKWKKMYYRAKSKKWSATFNQAAAKFMLENSYFYPPRDLPLMPINPGDWFEKVADVPPERLR